MDNREQAMTASGLNVIAGIWLIISPFVLGYSGTVSATNDIIIGIVVALLSLVRFFTPTTTGWVSWINIILGIWLIVAPFFLGYVMGAILWNQIILGLIVSGLAIWSSSAAAQQMEI